jgi:hypothetical protein
MPLARFVDACQPESELVRALETAARRYVANPAGARDDAALLRRQFETWAANDAFFQPVAENNKLLAEVIPVSKQLSALGAAGLLLMDYLKPVPPAPEEPAGNKKKKPSHKKPSKAELAAERAAESAKAGQVEWLANEKAELDRLLRPPARGAAGQQPAPTADVRLAAARPVKVLADAFHP